MYCPKCGRQIDNSSIFCPFCGQQVDVGVSNEKPASIDKAIGNQAKKWVIKVVVGLVTVAGVTVGAVNVFSDSDDKEPAAVRVEESKPVLEAPTETEVSVNEEPVDDSLHTVGEYQISNMLDLDDFIESIVTYRNEQEQNGLKMVDTMTLSAKGDRIVKITEVIDVDMSGFDEATQEQMTVAYDAMVEEYAAVEGVECTSNAGSGIYIITITIDATGDAVEKLAEQELLAIEGNGSKLSLKATGESLEASGYKLIK